MATDEASGPRIPLVLVIEDDPSVRTLMVRALEAAGYRALGAPDGMTAVHEARLEHPDLILSDLILPGYSGDTVALAIRDEPGLESVPVILVSGDQEIASRAEETGAADYVSKPFLPGDLVRRVRTVLAGR